MIYDALIVGAGVIGASAAIALHAQGVNVTLLDAKPAQIHSETPDLRMLALSYKTLSWMKEIQIYQACDPNRFSTYESMYLDAEYGEAPFTLRAAMVSRPYLGMMVDHQHLQSTMHSIIQKNMQAFFEEKLLNFEKKEDHYWVLTDKRSLKTRVIIAADGGKSLIKERLNITQFEHDYEQRALVAYVHSEKPHGHIAWQRFLSTGSLALLPCPDLKTESMVWTLPAHEAQPLQQLPTEKLSEHLQAALGSRLGRLTICSALGSFPLKATHAHHYGAPGLFLVGDAAHTIHPLAGLGANLGFADVRALVAILKKTDVSHWMDPRVLARYERERVSANRMVSGLMTGLNATMRQTGTVGKLRSWSIRLFDKITPLKALAILLTDEI